MSLDASDAFAMMLMGTYVEDQRESRRVYILYSSWQLYEKQKKVPQLCLLVQLAQSCRVQCRWKLMMRALNRFFELASMDAKFYIEMCYWKALMALAGLD